MNKIQIDKIIESTHPGIFARLPFFAKRFINVFLEKLLHIAEINDFLQANADKQDFAMVEAVLEHLDASILISCKDRQKIPSEGRLLCVANHPLGGLDALAILSVLREIRPDVKIVANDVLLHVTGLANLFLPYNLSSHKCQKENIKAIARALENEEAVVTFPAAEVSRLGISGVQEAPWQKGAVYFAKKCNAPILPIFVKARNSSLFYLVSLLNKRFSSLLLPHELMGRRSKKISLKVGDPIPAKVFTAGILDCKTETRLLKRHLFQTGKGRKGPFKTESTVIHPTDPRTMRGELEQAQLLGATHDGKKIFLVDYTGSPQVMREIGRLREITFRRVGEGTGKKLDIDQYDQHYKHLILWDELALDIVGAYRIGVCRDILAAHGSRGLYTSTLFNHSSAFESYLPDAIELGRSFVQQKYWNSRALDYLWQGIGAFIAHHSDVKYMFGGVSISNSYPEAAKDLIVYFYKKWFGDETALSAAKQRYVLTPKKESELCEVLSATDYDDDLKKLKAALKQYGYSIPILYKQYAELCDGKGVRFLDFGVDKDFENCVDGLILVEIDRITAAKKERYIYKQMHFAHNNGWRDLSLPKLRHDSSRLQATERLRLPPSAN